MEKVLDAKVIAQIIKTLSMEEVQEMLLEIQQNPGKEEELLQRFANLVSTDARDTNVD